MVLAHFNLLLQFHLLAQKLWRLDLAIERQIAPESARDAKRRMLHSFVFSHTLIGRQHRPLARTLLYVMIWTTVILLPVAVLLAVQVRFLPYHDASTTMWHRVLVTVDVLLILALWLRVVWGRDAQAVHKLCRERSGCPGRAAGSGPRCAAPGEDCVEPSHGRCWLSRAQRRLLPRGLSSSSRATLPSEVFGGPIEEALLDPWAKRLPSPCRIFWKKKKKKKRGNLGPFFSLEV